MWKLFILLVVIGSCVRGGMFFGGVVTELEVLPIMLHMLEGHSGYVKGVAVTGDGRRAVSASWDNTLKKGRVRP